METIVSGLADAYEGATAGIVWLAKLLSGAMLLVAAAASLALIVDLLFTPTQRFAEADRSARPSAGIVTIGRLIGVAAIIGGIVLIFRDTASAWQPVAALLGGAAVLAAMYNYLRRDDDHAAGPAKLAWLVLAAAAIVACVLAYQQRADSAIPYLLLCGVALAVAQSWFTRGRPEVRFDPSRVEVTRESRTDSALIVSELGMVYDLPDGGTVEALKDVSFTLEPGRLLTLLGPSGCGKTTLLNIIAGFLAPTSGEAKLGSSRIRGPGQDRGMVFQQGALFEWVSVNDNVGFGARMNGRSRPASRTAVQDLLNIVGLSEFGDKAVYELSGGMKQRVALARCLANDPEIILMDEPLGALDALTREKMQRLVLDLWHETGKTIVLVTHSVEEALYLGDQLIVMAPRPGRIERVYNLPFAQQALSSEARAIKASPEFIRIRDEILSMIWGMEEQIMGVGGRD